MDESLMDKLRRHYYRKGSSPKTLRATNRLATSVYLFSIISGLYCDMFFIFPWCYESSPTLCYYVKVGLFILFLELMANWLCIKCYNTAVQETKDRPDLVKTLWDDIPMESRVYHGSHNGRGYQNGSLPQTGEFNTAEEEILSWKYCQKCMLDVPPRSHHCPDCRKCILKRDHHCYFVGVCIGYFNQRYFVIFSFYMGFASFVSLAHMWYYMYYNVPESWTWMDYIPPVSVYNWLFTDTCPLHLMLMVVLSYILWWTGFLGAGFFMLEMMSITKGLTTFEFKRSVRIRCTGSLRDNFRSVFGDFWAFSFVIPSQILFKQPGNGLHWDNLKRC